MLAPFGTVAPGGTLEWAAPEQLVGLPVGAGSDVYSIALMVVALLKGIMWGEVTDFARALKRKASEQYQMATVKIVKEPELAFDEDADVPICGVLKQALQFDFTARPSLAEFKAALVTQAHSMMDHHHARNPNPTETETGSQISQQDPIKPDAGLSCWRELKYGFGQLRCDSNGELFWCMRDSRKLGGSKRNSNSRGNAQGACVFGS
jgi:hypothetical protein